MAQRNVRRGVMAVALAVIAMGAQAQSPPAPADEPGTVSALEVMATTRCRFAQRDRGARSPVLVDSFPAEGAEVRPGLLIIRLTFDRPMTCDGVLTQMRRVDTPCRTTQRMALSFNQRTIRVACLTEAGKSYGFRLSDMPNQTFVSQDGGEAKGHGVRFKASLGEPVLTLEEALMQDPAYAARRRD